MRSQHPSITTATPLRPKLSSDAINARANAVATTTKTNTVNNNPKALRRCSSNSTLSLSSERTINTRGPTILTTPPTPNKQLAPSRVRPSLRLRNQNQQNAPSLNPRQTISTTTTAAASASTTSSKTRSGTRSTSSTMPPGGDNSSRPRHPHLSATAAKALNRPPLTPKIAAAKAPQLAASPLTRRTNITATPTVAHSHRSDVTTTTTGVSPHLATTVTPRPGLRQNRVDSTVSTPSSTPRLERRSDSWETGSRTGSHVDSQNESNDSKFFYASNAKQGSQPQQQQPPQPVQRSSTFFYASGQQAEAKKSSSPSSHCSFTPMQASTPESTTKKFFHANGAPDHLAAAPAAINSPRMTPSRPGTANSAVSQGPALSQRSMSPVKVAPPPATHTNGGQTSSITGRPMASSPPSLTPPSAVGATKGKRRVSIEAPQRPGPPKGHARTGSVPSFHGALVPAYGQSPMSAPSSPPLSPIASHPIVSQPAMTMASILQAVEDMKSDDGQEDDSSPAEVHSPTKSTHGDAVSELIANARRERKVQDLEITNASLEAINRTLERQLRKQTAELRRFRRLSRSAHISAASSRVTSAAITEPPLDLSDLSEEESHLEVEPDSFHESDFSSDDSASADGRTSPNERMAHRRKRDEIRLQLDLSKHQELLIDSQKINQSIKRCLDWTDVLIREGQKALEYSVKVSDVKLGGHVLAPPDEEDDERRDLVLAIPDAEVADESLTNLEPPWETKSSSQDRDSGVELPA